MAVDSTVPLLVLSKAVRKEIYARGHPAEPARPPGCGGRGAGSSPAGWDPRVGSPRSTALYSRQLGIFS